MAFLQYLNFTPQKATYYIKRTKKDEIERERVKKKSLMDGLHAKNFWFPTKHLLEYLERRNNKCVITWGIIVSVTINGFSCNLGACGKSGSFSVGKWFIFALPFQKWKFITLKLHHQSIMSRQIWYDVFLCKVRTFWETHEIWKKVFLMEFGRLLSKCPKYEEDCANFCVLLRKFEL